MTSINSKTNLVKALAFLALPAATKGQDTLAAQPSTDSNAPNTEQTIQSTAVDSTGQSDTISLEDAMSLEQDGLTQRMQTPEYDAWPRWKGALSLTGTASLDNIHTAGIDFMYKMDEGGDFHISADVGLQESELVLEALHYMMMADPWNYPSYMLMIDYSDGIGVAGLGIEFDGYDGGSLAAYLGLNVSVADEAKFDNILGERQGYLGAAIGLNYSNAFMDDDFHVRVNTMLGQLSYTTRDANAAVVETGHGAMLRTAASIDYRVTPDFLIGVETKLGHIFGHGQQIMPEFGVRLGLVLR